MREDLVLLHLLAEQQHEHHEHQRLQRSRSVPAASPHLGYVHENVVIVEFYTVLVGTPKLRGENTDEGTMDGWSSGSQGNDGHSHFPERLGPA